ncbi:5-hydroxytryptamine receptor 1B-like [Daphnia carinata]|uniref:5-hydroxytryptamine receptor 1B-like n=1 Tax=Daphnia carinata TaxID=120202 RepID=UPI002868BDE8|nr:5-hydroxytryptamine receptor 1B-like [Daphnia carinata]
MDKPTSPATNVSLNVFEFQIMEQDFSFSQEFYRTLVIAVGAFLNCIVILVVSTSRQLRYPRHIFWIAISFFECLSLLEYALELTVVLYRSQQLCQILVLLYPMDYSILLQCFLLTAIDRYVSIVRYEWYKKTVTIPMVVMIIFVMSILTFAIFTSPLWMGYRSISACTFSLSHLNLMLSWDVTLGLICVMLHVLIFVESKAVIRRYLPSYRQPSVTVRFVNSSVRPSNFNSAMGMDTLSTERVTFMNADIPGTTQNATQPLNENAQSTADNQFNFQRIYGKRAASKVNRLEVQAAFNLSVNVLPFWLCTFPLSCFAIATYWCTRLGANCDTFLLLWTYMWDIFMLHSIYNPLMYMISCHDFRRAFYHIIRKLANKCNMHIQKN